MGKHYVPRQHLRRFAIDGRTETVWMYDKNMKKWSDAAISKVAQEPDFHSQNVEDALAGVVEKPGNKCIDKLVDRKKLWQGEIGACVIHDDHGNKRSRAKEET